jgi:hypothetical protein
VHLQCLKKYGQRAELEIAEEMRVPLATVQVAQSGRTDHWIASSARDNIEPRWLLARLPRPADDKNTTRCSI